MNEIDIGHVRDADFHSGIEEDRYGPELEMPEREAVVVPVLRYQLVERFLRVPDFFRFRNVDEQYRQDRHRENGYQDDEHRVHIGYFEMRTSVDELSPYGTPHQETDDERHYGSCQRVQGTSPLDKLVTLVSTASDGVQQRVHHGIQHTHGETCHERPQKIQPKSAGNLP